MARPLVLALVAMLGVGAFGAGDAGRDRPSSQMLVGRLTDEDSSANRRACASGEPDQASRCSLRAALAVAGTIAGPVTITVDDGSLLLSGAEPLVVDGHVRVVGTGTDATTITAGQMAPLFTVGTGDRLELQAVSLVGGRAPAERTAGWGTVELIDVVVSDGTGGSDLDRELAALCGPGGGRVRALPIARATITDQRALSAVPGGLA